MPQLNTPILFLVFNRPDTTRRVFEQIARHRPTQLFIAADGPRQSRPDDDEKCQEVRNILKDISWDCAVNYLYRDGNMGCRNAIASAIDWFFTHVEEGIILEDDCLPNDSFFYFCQELLSKYKTDTRVMMISGDNFQNDNPRGLAHYYFSRMAHIWGWATWRRAWNLYDIEMKDYPTFVKDQMI